MNCFNHSDCDAIGICKVCAKGICRQCCYDESGTPLACSKECYDRALDYERINDRSIKFVRNPKKWWAQFVALLVLIILLFSLIPHLLSFITSGLLCSPEVVPPTAFSQPEPPSLVVRSVEANRDGERVWFVVSVENTGSKPSFGYSSYLQVEMYDSDNKFVYECDKYLPNPIPADSEEDVLVSCGCGAGQTVPEFKSYKAKILGSEP